MTQAPVPGQANALRVLPALASVAAFCGTGTDEAVQLAPEPLSSSPWVGAASAAGPKPPMATQPASVAHDTAVSADSIPPVMPSELVGSGTATVSHVAPLWTETAAAREPLAIWSDPTTTQEKTVGQSMAAGVNPVAPAGSGRKVGVPSPVTWGGAVVVVVVVDGDAGPVGFGPEVVGRRPGAGRVGGRRRGGRLGHACAAGRGHPPRPGQRRHGQGRHRPGHPAPRPASGRVAAVAMASCGNPWAGPSSSPGPDRIHDHRGPGPA